MKFMEQLFTNNFFLYLMVFLTMMSIVGYIVNQDFDAVLFFIAFGIIMYRYNQNMSLVLLITLGVTSVYTYIINTAGNKVGFRSRYKQTTRKGVNVKNEKETRKKFKQYVEIKDTYNDLIQTIKSKTAKIKEMTSKIRK